MRAQRATTLDVAATITHVDRTFNGRRSASLERFLNDSRRPGADASDPWQRALRRDEFRQGSVESQNGGRRTLVAEHLWLRRLCKGEVAQQSADDCVDIGDRRHRRRSLVEPRRFRNRICVDGATLAFSTTCICRRA